MKLTMEKLNEVASSLSADRVRGLYDTAKEKGGNSGEAAKIGFAMMLIGVLTTRRIASELGITADNEVEVTEAMFNKAVGEVISQADDDDSFIKTMETTIFSLELSTALFGKENDDDSEKADS